MRLRLAVQAKRKLGCTGKQHARQMVRGHLEHLQHRVAGSGVVVLAERDQPVYIMGLRAIGNGLADLRDLLACLVELTAADL